MKYNYYAQKLEAFWGKRKHWIIAAFVVVAVMGVISKILNDTPENRIKKALFTYHNDKGKRVEIKILSFRPAPEYITDSIQLSRLLDIASRQIKNRYASDNTFQQDTLYADSLESITNQINYLRNGMKEKKSLNLTVCRYLAITSGSEKHTDTLAAILNQSNIIVWPAKK